MDLRGSQKQNHYILPGTVSLGPAGGFVPPLVTLEAYFLESASRTNYGSRQTQTVLFRLAPPRVFCVRISNSNTHLVRLAATDSLRPMRIHLVALGS